MDDDMLSISIWAPESTADDLDAMAERWDPYQDHKVKRSAIGREALGIGIQALEAMERHWSTETAASMTSRDRRHVIESALGMYFASLDSDDSEATE